MEFLRQEGRSGMLEELYSFLDLFKPICTELTMTSRSVQRTTQFDDKCRKYIRTRAKHLLKLLTYRLNFISLSFQPRIILPIIFTAVKSPKAIVIIENNEGLNASNSLQQKVNK